ncbi:hypothetical protein Hanom_Chr16g01522521 [Helianthus anomalus]
MEGDEWWFTQNPNFTSNDDAVPPTTGDADFFEIRETDTGLGNSGDDVTF